MDARNSRDYKEVSEIVEAVNMPLVNHAEPYTPHFIRGIALAPCHGVGPSGGYIGATEGRCKCDGKRSSVQGRKLLHWAGAYLQASLMQRLLLAGADPRAADNSGKNTLDMAQR
jgi:hypothetical protein